VPIIKHRLDKVCAICHNKKKKEDFALEVLHRPGLLQAYFEQFHIGSKFTAADLQFRLLRFGKGEFLTAPYRKLEDILFLVKGCAKIYHLRADGGISPVASVTSGTIFGDVEFATGHPTAFYSETMSEALCIGLSLSRYDSHLRKDTVFLNEMLRSVGEKLDMVSSLEASSQSLEEKLLFYLEFICPDGCLHSVNDAVMQMHCSRRQLQRVLKKLCDTGRIEKQCRGTYRLSAGADGQEP